MLAIPEAWLREVMLHHCLHLKCARCDRDRYLAIATEYVEGETLQVFLEKAGGWVVEPLARFIFQQLVIAVDYCHKKGKVRCRRVSDAVTCIPGHSMRFSPISSRAGKIAMWWHDRARPASRW